MKVDLDELERMAHASGRALRSAAGDGSQLVDDETSRFLTSSPPVTLALIARIRELEIALGELVAECEERTENPDGDFYAEPRDLLEKGVVP